MKRKLALIGSIALVLVVLAIWAVPAFADDGSSSTPPAAQGAQGGNIMKVLVRLLLVQDEAKVDAYIAKAVDAGKLTAEQATKVKDFWTARHAKFIKNVILVRLLKAQDQSKVQAFLDKAVTAGKIQQAQADKVIQIWVILHTPVPANAAK
jgi:polyhydroxyalkanoate synthesis regulator phasin